MATTQLSDVIVPEVFSAYVAENSVEKSALVQSSVMARNQEMEAQLKAGADSFTVPYWKDLGDDEANITNDDPSKEAVPAKLSTGKQIVRKSFLHKSWSAMNLASELAGSDAIARIQARAADYWTRQTQRRLVATLNGLKAENVANGGGDMVLDISALSAAASKFSAAAVIQACATLGDSMRDVVAIGMHSKTYAQALQNDLIQTLPDSQGGFVQTFRGLAIIVDDLMPVAADVYTSVLFGPGAFGYGLTDPRIALATEVENKPGAGNGGGMQILHSRVNLAIHPLGYRWLEGDVLAESPTIAELAKPENWQRVGERKHVPLAFLVHKL
ncbi:MAG: major capsid protein [Comamonas sp.]|uniref:major capsid protein n=1 Tax=Comamonas sp. TaxID=34028 RepID=UPI002FC65B93